MTHFVMRVSSYFQTRPQSRLFTGTKARAYDKLKKMLEANIQKKENGKGLEDGSKNDEEDDDGGGLQIKGDL